MPRFATLNLENLFTRPVAMRRESDKTGNEVLRDLPELNTIVLEPIYPDEDKNRFVQLSLKYVYRCAGEYLSGVFV